MTREWGRWLAALVFGVVLLVPSQSSAGGLLTYHKAHCSKPSYTPFHYWQPGIYRVAACLCGPHEPLYAPVRYPQIIPRSEVIGYPCPPVDPSEFYFERYLRVSAYQGGTTPRTTQPAAQPGYGQPAATPGR
jgi:hypothetical protein